MARLRRFLNNELLELKVEDVKDASVRDFPQKVKVENVKMKFACEFSLKNNVPDFLQNRKMKDVRRKLSSGVVVVIVVVVFVVVVTVVVVI